MSTLNELIAVAIDNDIPDTPETRKLKRRSRIRLTSVLWLLMIVLAAYEFEHIVIGLGMDSVKTVETESVEVMYDRAQQILTGRFQRGELLDQPFDDVQLDRWIGVLYQGEGSYTIYYTGALEDEAVPARNLQFSWE